ncbi:Antisense-enhancing sequence 1 [Wallemia ichthyophaga EXF-994]|uniref:Antisense-enhancing sequence 1 n=1 Tax=Wallemia ichthyophaga (strain EXF-994 / CBS 113033) TaxID=1299270 RepID=R9ADC0_WALI9|nr:Antisense-enhancing sequence 1 [Wallemia ichthyophaga EXF-994]EOR00110.1 Antisense-enhancing sequence 1 [Wallemia ichthyophaga EXF-994]
MTTHKFNQVDVFTDEPYRGNALAVVSLTAGTATDDGAMQRFANWTNLSETTFLAPSNKADYSVRIFTPACELPFAGHPTLGTAHVYLNALSPEQRRAIADRGGSLTQECAAGVLQLRWDARSDVISFQAPPLNRFADVQAELLDRVCRGVSISRDDIVDAKWIDNGPPWFALRLHNADIVLDAKLSDRGAIDGLYFGIFGEHTAGHSQATFEVRGFAYDVGEDPVTGSLNAGIAMWMKNETPAHYLNSQGTALGRKGLVSVTKDGDDIWIGGSVMGCIEGTVVL